MRSLSSLSRPVHRIVFGTATMLGIGSLLAFAASQQSSRAVASPSDAGVSYVTHDEATYPMGDLADGNEQAATPVYSTWEDALRGMEGISNLHCCVGSAGSCTVWAGSGCPSGSTPKPCPCNDPL